LRRLGQHEAECAFRFYECAKCGVSVFTDSKKTHDSSVCVEREVACDFARYGCSRPVLPRREYAEHSRERLREHLALLMSRDANASTPETAVDVDGYGTDCPFAPDALGSTGVPARGTQQRKEPLDGFRVLVTKHEVTRADARRVAGIAAAAAAAVEAETAAYRSALRATSERVEESRDAMRAEMRRSRDRFDAMCAATLATFDRLQTEEESIVGAGLRESSETRRSSLQNAANADALDAIAEASSRFSAALAVDVSDAKTALGNAFVSSLANAASALEAKGAMEATRAETAAGLRARLAEVEWASAEAAGAAWDEIGDAREGFHERIQAREDNHRALLSNIRVLETETDAGIRADRGMRAKRRAERDGGGGFGGEESDGAVEDSGAPAVSVAPATPRGAGASRIEVDARRHGNALELFEGDGGSITRR
jgi:hypothetical protein